jgi:hypothetical protein
LVAGPRWAPDTMTDWQTDCRSYCDFDFEQESVIGRAPDGKEMDRWRQFQKMESAL